jgi:cell wall-associated NlpC family hydrolase
MMALTLALFFSACAPIVRPYYVRDAGGYVTPTPAMTPTALVPEELASVTFSDDDDRLRKVAESYLGVPYRFGGRSKSGMDCSGFVGQVFSEAYGVKLPRSSRSIYKTGAPVAKSALKPGDLVFFRSLGYIDHSGIYMGANYFIHSATSVGVSYSALDAPYFRDHYAGARRMSAITNL